VPTLLCAQESQPFESGSDTVWLSERTVYGPDVVVVMGTDTLPAGAFSATANAKGIVFDPPAAQSGVVYFRALSVDLSAPLFLRSRAVYGTRELPKAVENLSEPGGKDPLEGLQRSGSIGRSLSVGNAQSAVLNSSLNLQLRGNIGSGTELEAVIAESSLPNPGSGVSQTLREYDQLFIELRNPEFGRIRAGDLDLTRASNRFLSFEKRVTGGLVETEWKTARAKSGVLVTGALARGQFHRVSFFGAEGNQGPYALTGSNGERSIRVISGSERVYIDGMLLERGADRDYLLDPLTGELRFTNLRPIRRENRIVVEFQYTDQNYVRSAFYGRGFRETPEGRWEASLFSEQDDPDRPLSLDLTDADRLTLSLAGDAASVTGLSSIRPATGAVGELRYALVDSLGQDSVLVFLENGEPGGYTAQFLEVGAGKGHYVFDRQLASGAVYQWVPPVGGIPSGTHEPIRVVATPGLLQVADVGYRSSEQGPNRFSLEAAASRNVLNRYSELDRDNDVGLGFSGTWARALDTRWGLSAEVQWNDASFRTVERIRNVEFARDWNLPTADRELGLAGVEVGYKDAQNSRATLRLDALRSASLYSGIKPSATLDLRSGRERWVAAGSVLWNRDTTAQALFVRYSALWKHAHSAQWGSGIRGLGEANQRSVNAVRALSSYGFHEAEGFTAWGDSIEQYVQFRSFVRAEDSVVDGSLQPRSLSYGLGTQGMHFSNVDRRWQWAAQYRILEAVDRARISTATSRVGWSDRFWKRALDGNVLYEASTGSEPVRDVVYVRVPDGTGTLTWIDYNANGLEELDEFEPARFPDEADYARLLTPAAALVRSAQTLWSHTLQFSPGVWFTSAHKPLWARFDLRWNASWSEREVARTGLNALNPFRNSADSTLLGRNRTHRWSVFYNRSRLDFGCDYHYQTTSEQTLQSVGLERSGLKQHEFNVRWGKSRQWSLLGQGLWTQNSRINPGFAGRNYEFQGPRIELTPAYQFNDRWKCLLKVGFRSAVSVGDESAELDAGSLGAEWIHNQIERSSLRAEVTWVNNRFSGPSTSPLGYAMLDGLQTGGNALWSCSWSQRILDFLQLDLRYEGRSSANAPTIHTGNVQIKAVF